MTDEDLITTIIRQESSLILDRFDEDAAYAIGSAIRTRALAQQAPIVVDIRSAARRYYFAALPGSTPENEDWARRKGNTVLRCHMSSMRVGLQQKSEGRTQWPEGGLHPRKFVTHGGGFPISVRQVGVVAAIGISGLPSLQDHELSATVLAEHLGIARIPLPV